MKNIFLLISVIYSLNAFSQWEEVNSNTTETLTDIFFIDESNGYCIGNNGTIIKTYDSGNTWTNISFNSEDVKQLYFLNAESGIVVCNNNIYKTIDGGDIFLDITDIFIVEDYDISKIQISFKNEFGIIKVIYTDAASTLLKSYKTFDFGDTFEDLIDFSSNDYGFYYISSADIFYYVENNLLKTIDGGITWETIPNIMFSFPPFQETFQIFNNNMGVATDSYTYEYSTFNLNDNSINYQSPDGYKSFDFIGNNGFYIQGNFSGNDKFFKSSDYGVNLTEIANLEPNVVFYSIDFIDENTGFICGENGKLFKTITGGIVNISDDENLEKKIEIFPNPAKNILKLKIPKEIPIDNISLYTIQGELVKTFDKIETELKIDGISGGNYILKINSDKSEITRKIVIEAVRQ